MTHPHGSLVRTFFSLACCALMAASPAAAQTYSGQAIQATSNIFGAGLTLPPAPAGGGGGTLPPSYSLNPGTGRILQFTSVSGTFDCCKDDPLTPANGPDGRPGTASREFTDLDSVGGISGITALDRVGFLTGVFLTDDAPVAPAPARLDFTGNSGFTQLAPVIGQTFFIGDGRSGTGAGAIQAFHVPDGATRLFLGFADGFAFNGPPGYYDDNLGTMTASFSIQGAGSETPAVPEPSAVLLFLPVLVGLVGSRYLHRRPR